MFAGAHGIGGLTAIIDYNKVQLTDSLSDTLDVEPLRPKWEAFGWEVLECDGHDVGDLVRALDEARAVTDRPCVVIAHTVKGKGISFAEHQAAWHAKAPNKEEFVLGMKELDEQEAGSRS